MARITTTEKGSDGLGDGGFCLGTGAYLLDRNTLLQLLLHSLPVHSRHTLACVGISSVFKLGYWSRNHSSRALKFKPRRSITNQADKPSPRASKVQIFNRAAKNSILSQGKNPLLGSGQKHRSFVDPIVHIGMLHMLLW